MYFKTAKVISVVLFFIYAYVKTKEKLPLFAMIYLLYFALCGFTFKFLFPEIRFGSATIEYLVFLTIVGIPFLVGFYKVGMLVDKMPKEDKEKIFKPVFEATRSNIIFWAFIVLMNLLAFIMDNHK